MYSISLYTQWFNHDNSWYLYNSQSNFFCEVSETLISLLKEHRWNDFDEKTISFLLHKHIIEHEGNIYDYYLTQKMSFIARNYDQSVLNLVIVPTTACNFDCPYCFEPKASPKIMSSETIDNICNFITAHKNARTMNIIWYGGEPLLAFPQIKELTDLFKQPEMPTLKRQSLITNASLLNEEMCSFFNEIGLNSIQITFDGIRSNHNKTRCFKANHSPSFDIIYQHMHMDRTLIPKCDIHVRINVNKENLDDYVEMHKIISADFNNDPKVSIYPGLIREDSSNGKSFHTKCIQSRDLVKMHSHFKNHGIQCKIFPTKKRRGCMMFSRNSYIIGPEGELYKCWNDVSDDNKIIGNIASPELINHSLLVKYMIGSTPFQDMCRDCKVFPICGGGCGQYNYRNNFEKGNYAQCSPFKDTTNLIQALIDGSLTELTDIKEK